MILTCNSPVLLCASRGIAQQKNRARNLRTGDRGLVVEEDMIEIPAYYRRKRIFQTMRYKVRRYDQSAGAATDRDKEPPFERIEGPSSTVWQRSRYNRRDDSWIAEREAPGESGMRKQAAVWLLMFFAVLSGAGSLRAQKLSTHWEELTGPDFRDAIAQSKGTCLLPFGILEKHGAHLPLGTDLLDVRYAALHAAAEEFAVVFPEYYFGQIAEAKHEPGTVAYSREMQLALLEETTAEMARNGCKKVIIVNGHGGNESLLPFFAQTQLDKPHDYVVYVFDSRTPSSGGPAKKTSIDMHAAESETALRFLLRPH